MLSESARRILERGGLPTGNVEMWLSSLAERQPFMSQTEGTLNQAVFQIISMELYNLIVKSQLGYVEAGPPWLHRLVRLWHRRRIRLSTSTTTPLSRVLSQPWTHLTPTGTSSRGC